MEHPQAIEVDPSPSIICGPFDQDKNFEYIVKNTHTTRLFISILSSQPNLIGISGPKKSKLWQGQTVKLEGKFKNFGEEVKPLLKAINVFIIVKYERRLHDGSVTIQGKRKIPINFRA
ncbi:unnamed protein product [Bursaphelenchus okinawaensis]|uniref:Uncharacterized protein n=1 Tax=Bursaphelenchus okinawaensis TaxID=465554 RepID=A0A811L6M5_9BILA|nr:unnamed protein product [Bursaphelenchus okinawaensis]CAG9116802.1 unnamed protein product [Bursaphelenchus okinawaensis]